MSKVFTKEWAIAALIRALRTLCQTAVATIGTSAMISEVNWIQVASTSALAAILSLLMSLSGLPEVEAEVKPEVKDEKSGEEH